MVLRGEYLSQGVPIQEQRKAPLCIVEHNFPEELLVFAKPGKSLSDVEQATRVQRGIRHALQATHRLNGETVEGIEVNEENFSTLDRSAFFKRGLGIPLIYYFNGSPSKAKAFAYPEIAERLAQNVPPQRSLTLLPPDEGGGGGSEPDHLPQFIELFQTHHDRVARYIAIRIGNIDDADDLASEVFVRGLKAISSYRDTGAPMEAWLFKIARNTVIDHLRDRERKPAPVELLETIPGIDEPQGQVERDLERAEEVQWLHSAMQHLSHAQRQVLALKYGADMSSQQIAAVVGKRDGAVREMQSAAIAKLRLIAENDLIGEETLAAKLGTSSSLLGRKIKQAEEEGNLVLISRKKIENRIYFSKEEVEKILEFFGRRKNGSSE